MFDNENFNEQDDFFSEVDSGLVQQDFDNSSADFFGNEGEKDK